MATSQKKSEAKIEKDRFLASLYCPPGNQGTKNINPVKPAFLFVCRQKAQFRCCLDCLFFAHGTRAQRGFVDSNEPSFSIEKAVQVKAGNR